MGAGPSICNRKVHSIEHHRHHESRPPPRYLSIARLSVKSFDKENYFLLDGIHHSFVRIDGKNYVFSVISEDQSSDLVHFCLVDMCKEAFEFSTSIVQLSQSYVGNQRVTHTNCSCTIVKQQYSARFL